MYGNCFRNGCETMRLKNKVCIIIGGASGIGKETAKQYHKEGAIVYVIDRKPILMEDEIQNSIVCDVTDEKKIQKEIYHIYEKEKKIDVLFYIAGIDIIGNVEQTTIEEFKKILDVNLMGILYVLKAILPIMRHQHYGNIILPGSDQCFMAKTDSSAYGMTKAAISYLTKSVAIDYAKYQIRVNSICPGPVDTPMYQKNIDYICQHYPEYNDKDELLKLLASRQPMNRIGHPKEIANLAVFLASDESSYMTGSEVRIDGGSTIGTL